MRIRSTRLAACTRSIAIVSCALLTGATALDQPQLHRFDDPIDALSIGVPTDDIQLQVSARVDGTWQPWETLEIEKEFDPLLRESNLVLFPEPVTDVRVRGATKEYDMHPIRVSHAPPSYEVAAQGLVGAPRVLTRAQWGADESLLVDGEEVERSDIAPEENGSTNSSTSSARIEQCKQWQEDFPRDFRTARTVTHTKSGEKLRWAQEYSNDVRLLVVHHTAIKVTDDPRPPHERMRALYTYHADSRGWGDIGYHFVVDEEGQIYEGKAGGKYVVGGHAYCSNVSTIGIALMGNFEVEQPTQAQVKSLQWLLYDLAREYKVDFSTAVDYHGEKLEQIVGHGALVSTACPGYYMNQVMTQVRRHVEEGDIDVPVRFPTTLRRTDREGITTPTAVKAGAPVLSAVGSTELTGLPGGQTKVSLLYRAGSSGAKQRDRIADVTRTDSRIGVWQDIGTGREMRIRQELLLPKSVRAGETAIITLRIQFPREAVSTTLQIGNVRYTLKASGRRTIDPALRGRLTPSAQDATVRVQPSVVRPRPTATAASNSSRATARRTVSNDAAPIRIRLSYEGQQATLQGAGGIQIPGKTAAYGTLRVQKEFDTCIAYDGPTVIARGIVQMQGVADPITISSWQQTHNRFRGIIECRVIDDQLVLINELPLEEYLAGLAEEPDTEPYEKQRAFAVAARSYAAHYMESTNRKFPGMPYDGDDSPARFQKYGGVAFEEAHPGWVRAVRSTADIVVKKDGKIVKTAYFSSDDGRTRAPSEIGWGNYPFAEVFASKPDPWCNGMPMNGHGVGMSGCGSKGQALEGKTGEQILQYYYPGTLLTPR
jgi:hypothetical protein